MSDKITVEQAVPLWEEWMRNVGREQRTIEGATACMMTLFKPIGSLKMHPDFITADHIRSWIGEGDIRYRTMLTKRGFARSFFDFCVARGWTKANPANEVEINPSKLDKKQVKPISRKPFTNREFNTLLDNTEGFWRAAIAISRGSGLSLFDIACLEHSAFKKKGVLLFGEHSLPLTSETVAAMKKVRVADRKYCFPDQREIAISRTRRANLSVQFKRLCMSLGIKDHSFSDLQRAYIEDARHRGLPLSHIYEKTQIEE